MIRTLIVDDSSFFRAHLKAFLSIAPEVEIIDEAECGMEAITKSVALEPDVVLMMDVSMNGMNGLEAARRLRKALPSTAIIILSLHNLDVYRHAAKAAGACAFVEKKTLADDLLPAIRKAAQTSRKENLPVSRGLHGK